MASGGIGIGLRLWESGFQFGISGFSDLGFAASDFARSGLGVVRLRSLDRPLDSVGFRVFEGFSRLLYS